MENNKIKLIGFIGVFCLLILILVFIVSSLMTSKNTQTSPFQNNPPEFPFFKRTISPTPVGSKHLSLSYIYIRGVKVKSFYRTSEEIDINKDAIIVNKDSYVITYLPKDSQFFFNIYSFPFEQYRTQAEKEFLSVLGINENDACKLKVKIATYNSQNTAYFGTYYGLSFCK